jgi:DNA-binding NtrC family response regulator
MTSVFLIGLEQETAGQIFRALDVGRHQIREQPRDVLIRELHDADIVFAGGEPTWYLTLLKRVREARPALPFVVVTRIAETKEWLDALEAGATDYCSAPIETRQLRWLMESAMPRLRPVSKRSLMVSTAA